MRYVPFIVYYFVQFYEMVKERKTTCVEISEQLKGAPKAEYEFGSFERLNRPNNNDTNRIANFGRITEIIKKMCEAVATR